MFKKNEKRNKKRSLTQSVFAGTALCVITTMLTSAITAVLTARGYLPENMIVQATMASVFIGVFIGAFVTAKIEKREAFLCGIAAGICFFLTRCAVCFIAEDGKLINSLSIGLIFCTVCGMFGGALLGSRDKKRRSHS